MQSVLGQCSRCLIGNSVASRLTIGGHQLSSTSSSWESRRFITRSVSSTLCHYEVLGISNKCNASAKEIKDAYLLRTKEFHPDVSTDDTVDFVRIKEAYEVLKDEQKRREYDRTINPKRITRNTINRANLRYKYDHRSKPQRHSSSTTNKGPSAEAHSVVYTQEKDFYHKARDFMNCLSHEVEDWIRETESGLKVFENQIEKNRPVHGYSHDNQSYREFIQRIIRTKLYLDKESLKVHTHAFPDRRKALLTRYQAACENFQERIGNIDQKIDNNSNINSFD